MKFFLLFMRNLMCRNCSKRYYSSRLPTSNVVKVVSSNDDECIKISLKFSNSPYLNIKASKLETVSVVLSRIKLMVALQRTKEEIYRSVANKYSNNARVAIETVENCDDVSLIADNKKIDERISNAEAWTQASILKIGSIVYEVQYNTPKVVNLTLPSYIVAGCILRPHFLLECASFEDSIFTWYRSVQVSDVLDVDLNLSDWVKVGDEFHYQTSTQDIGCYLKLICKPKQGNVEGPQFTAFSQNVVASEPAVFPFESRHAFTPIINDCNMFRCVSYNTLANIYVERRKFPYASERARDVYYRKQLLFREILGYNADVICLQEVQERVFEYDFMPVFKKAGFKGFYTRKGGRTYEGLTTFIRSSKFNIICSEGILLNKVVKERSIFNDLLAKVSGNYKDMSKMLAQDTSFQVSLLESIVNPQNRILLANTHLYSNKDMPEVRLIQAALCVFYIKHFIKEKCENNTSVIFCGDFNSLPLSEVYNFLTTGSIECFANWKNSNINSNLNEDTTLQHDLNLKSACGTPQYTNYTEEFQGCLDYIFYSQDTLEVTDVVPMPDHEDVTAQIGLPSEYFPSDHLALVCTLKWKDKNL